MWFLVFLRFCRGILLGEWLSGCWGCWARGRWCCAWGGVVVVVDEVAGEVVIDEYSWGSCRSGNCRRAEPGAVGAALGMGWMGGVVALKVVGTEPGAVGAALGMGMVGVTRLVTASQPSRAARSCARRRLLLAASRRWTSGCVVTIAKLFVGSTDLQVVRERCHEPVTLCERGARLVGRLLDDDLHTLKGTSRCVVAGIFQLIRRIAGELCDGVHAQDRSTETLDRIPRTEVVWRSMARGRVVEVAMVRHRRPQARPGFSRMPSQALSGLRPAWMGLRLRR